MEQKMIDWNNRWKELIESQKLSILLETDEQTNYFLLNTSFRMLKSEDKPLHSDEKHHFWKITDRTPGKWTDSRGYAISDYLWNRSHNQKSYLIITNLFSSFLLTDKLIRSLWNEIMDNLLFEDDLFYIVLDKTKK